MLTIPLVGGAFALGMIPALKESPPRQHLQIWEPLDLVSPILNY